MSVSQKVTLTLLVFVLFLSGGCAGLLGREPIEVVVVGIEPLPGEGLEFRMLVKLRVQNPNETALEFNGVSVQMDVQGNRFATGVSDTAGSVPRFGETIVKVPMSISAFHMARQAIDVINNEYRGKLAYELNGTLAKSGFNNVRFTSQGDLTLPAEFFEGSQ